MDIEHVGSVVAARHRGRRWLLLIEAAAGAKGTVEQLWEWGAAGIMVVAGIEGVGDLPAPDRTFCTRVRIEWDRASTAFDLERS